MLILSGGRDASAQSVQPDDVDNPYRNPQCCQSKDPGKFVLPADRYKGDVELEAAYTAAKEIPGTCCKILCYCGCDHTHQHKSLLQCFVSTHAEDCSQCKGEALRALVMTKKGKTLAQIQEAIDQEQFSEYLKLFRPSKIMKDYRQINKLDKVPQLSKKSNSKISEKSSSEK
jgi:hypothetical protein